MGVCGAIFCVDGSDRTSFMGGGGGGGGGKWK